MFPFEANVKKPAVSAALTLLYEERVGKSFEKEAPRGMLG